MSIERLREFLKNDELDPDAVTWREEPAVGEMYSCHKSKNESVYEIYCMWILTKSTQL